MWLEKHVEFKLNCESLAEWLRELSPEGPEDFDETLALWVWDLEESAVQIKSHLEVLRRSFADDRGIQGTRIFRACVALGAPYELASSLCD